MEEAWITDFMEAQMGEVPGDKKCSTQSATHLRKSERNRDDCEQSEYITPPNLRKGDAAEAASNLRVPVMAVKVLPEEGAQSRAVEPLSLSQPSCEPEWDSSTSCVPPGAAWVTMVQPPRREKRSRKVRWPCPRWRLRAPFASHPSARRPPAGPTLAQASHI